MFVAAEGMGSSSTNCFDKSRRQYVVKAPGFSVTRARTTRWTTKEGRKEGIRDDLQEKGTRKGRGRGRGLSKFRLNSPRINIRNGAPGCHKLACCPLLSFPDSTICAKRGRTLPFTINSGLFRIGDAVRRYITTRQCEIAERSKTCKN